MTVVLRIVVSAIERSAANDREAVLQIVAGVLPSQSMTFAASPELDYHIQSTGQKKCEGVAPQLVSRSGAPRSAGKVPYQLRTCFFWWEAICEGGLGLEHDHVQHRQANQDNAPTARSMRRDVAVSSEVNHCDEAWGAKENDFH